MRMPKLSFSDLFWLMSLSARVSGHSQISEWECRVAKAVLAWYFLRAAYIELAPHRVREQPGPEPNSRSKAQRAAVQEAEVFFDRMLESGAWNRSTVERLTESYKAWGSDGRRPVQDGWPVVDPSQHKLRVGWGLSRKARTFVEAALRGGEREIGFRLDGLLDSTCIPPWKLSEQLKKAVLEEENEG